MSCYFTVMSNTGNIQFSLATFFLGGGDHRIYRSCRPHKYMWIYLLGDVYINGGKVGISFPSPELDAEDLTASSPSCGLFILGIFSSIGYHVDVEIVIEEEKKVMGRGRE